jgi:hypothetical protein
MSDNLKISLVAAVTIVIAAFIAFGRYQGVATGRGAAYEIDRFTGAARLCTPDGCRDVPSVEAQRPMTDEEVFGPKKQN